MKRLSLFLITLLVVLSSCDKKILVTDITVNEAITKSTTWDSTKTYVIDGTVYVTDNQVLTILPGTKIKFTKGSEFDIGNGDYGTIIAKGTAKDPIIFTSDAPIKNAGDWNGFWLYDGANACVFEYCIFEYGGGYSEDQGVMNLRSTEASFKNCTFIHSGGYGIELRNCGFKDFENNTIKDCANYEMKIDADQVHTIGADNTYDNGAISVAGADLDKTGTFTWKNIGIPYVVKGNINVGSTQGTTLALEPGTVVEFGSGVEVDFGYSSDFGSIKAEGTEALPIIFTSAAAYPTNGDWDGFWFYGNTMPGTIFDYCEISYGGGYSDNSGNINIKYEGSTIITISNSTISYSGSYGIYKGNVQDPSPTLSNNTFVDNTLGDTNY